MPLDASFFADVPLVKFLYLVFTGTPGGVTIAESGLRCCVPCLSRYYFPLWVILHRNSRPHSVSDYNYSL